jgi:hypothetical protein
VAATKLRIRLAARGQLSAVSRQLSFQHSASAPRRSAALDLNGLLIESFIVVSVETIYLFLSDSFSPNAVITGCEE